MFERVKCDNYCGYYLHICRVKCGGADVENQYRIRIQCRIRPDGLLYCYTVVVLSNNLLVTLVTQKIVVDRPL